jgi:hypothetical protein
MISSDAFQQQLQWIQRVRQLFVVVAVCDGSRYYATTVHGNVSLNDSASAAKCSNNMRTLQQHQGKALCFATAAQAQSQVDTEPCKQEGSLP